MYRLPRLTKRLVRGCEIFIPALPGLAWVLFSKIYIPFCSRLYKLICDISLIGCVKYGKKKGDCPCHRYISQGVIFPLFSHAQCSRGRWSMIARAWFASSSSRASALPLMPAVATAMAISIYLLSFLPRFVSHFLLHCLQILLLNPSVTWWEPVKMLYVMRSSLQSP